MSNSKGKTFSNFVPISKRPNFKVEKIWEDSLNLIPSPSSSAKIQIIARKVCLRCKVKTMLGAVNKLLKTKSLLTSPSNANFPANNLNFLWRWRWWDQIQTIFLKRFYFTWMLSKKLQVAPPLRNIKNKHKNHDFFTMDVTPRVPVVSKKPEGLTDQYLVFLC